MDILADRGHKRTLLNLMMTSRRLLFLGIGPLVRKISLPDEFGPLLDKWRGLVSDALGTGKLGKVESLDVHIGGRDPLFADLLLGAGASLNEPEFVVADRAGLEAFLGSIQAAKGLRRVTIGLREGLAISAGWESLNPRADPFLPLLRHLDRLDSLEEVILEESEQLSFLDPVPGSRSWPAAFGDHPRAASKLRSLYLDFDNATTTLQDWTAEGFRSIERVHFNLMSHPEEPGVMRRMCDAFPGLRHLTINFANTAVLADFDFGRLESLELEHWHLDLPPESFPRVRAAVAASGVRISISPNWEPGFDGELHNARDSWDCLAVAKAWREEELFWRGIEGVRIDRLKIDGYANSWWELLHELCDEWDEEAVEGDGSGELTEEQRAEFAWLRNLDD
ncbi:hypothetical protein DFJ74DRAFT_677790 [Hyaloraphidium curvatum]|nr:hypothetical protein DFJ74DRAFT_677790 [Hyaloraphidium curvatum]